MYMTGVHHLYATRYIQLHSVEVAYYSAIATVSVSRLEGVTYRYIKQSYMVSK